MLTSHQCWFWPVAKFLLVVSATLFGSEAAPRFPETPRRERDGKYSMPNEIYNFPFLVSFVYAPGKTFVSAGTIISESWVATSVDNFMLKPGLAPHPYYALLSDIQAFGGTYYMNPMKEVSHGLLPQSKKVMELHVALEASWLNLDHMGNPKMKRILGGSASNLTKEIAFDAIGVAVGVGLVLTSKWTWTSLLLPMPLLTGSLSELISRYKQQLYNLENYASAQMSCYVGAWSEPENRLTHYEVVHVPLMQCQLTYCERKPQTCFRFPRQGHHVCFKAVAYGDLCSVDKGSALYCWSFGKGVFAILTTAEKCGWDNLPGVYTAVPTVIKMFETVSGSHYSPVDVSRYRIAPPEHE